LKLAEVTTGEVRERQRSQLSSSEWANLERLKLSAIACSKAPENRGGQEIAALWAGVDHLFERRSVAHGHEILAEALNQALGSIDLDVLKTIMRGGGAELVPLTAEPSLSGEYATRRGLELERWAVAFIDATKGQCAPFNPSFEPSERLSAEQRDAVRSILSTTDQVFSLRGVAGAGKTTTLREVQDGFGARRVHYVAPTAAAAKVLKGEGFGNATTVEDFLQNVSRRESLSGAVVVCDEAGLKSNRQGAELLRLAQKYRLRVIFVGDVRQHVSVEAGDFLRVLEMHSQLGRCEIREIRRQAAAPEYRAAVDRMAAGDARGGLRAFAEMGWIKAGGADYLSAAASEYLRFTQDGASLDRCLVVAPTWAENFRLTKCIRDELKKRGRLPSAGMECSVYDSLRWTVQQKTNPRNYVVGQAVSFNICSGGWKKGELAQVQRIEAGEVWLGSEGGKEQRLDLRTAKAFDVGNIRAVDIAVGDKVLVRANARNHGLINGQVLTVESIRPDRTIHTQEGVTIPVNFPHWCHGYVVTSHKAQGRTCDHVVVTAEKLDAKSAYVACSRGRISCSVHTPDTEELLARLPEGTRRAALDVLGKAQRGAIFPSILGRAQAWSSVVRHAVERSVTGIRKRMEHARQLVQRWRAHAIFVHQTQEVARRRAQIPRPHRTSFRP
jgi:hypothetical protein